MAARPGWLRCGDYASEGGLDSHYDWVPPRPAVLRTHPENGEEIGLLPETATIKEGVDRAARQHGAHFSYVDDLQRCSRRQQGAMQDSGSPMGIHDEATYRAWSPTTKDTRDGLFSNTPISVTAVRGISTTAQS